MRPTVDAVALRAAPILILGGTGQIGRELVRALGSAPHVHAPNRGALDIADSSAVRDCLRAVRPKLIVNAAAYTAVDAAESDSETCFALNADAPGFIAREARRLGAVVVHYSTDYVFDGQRDTPYTEADAANPLNAYGRSKLEGEKQVLGAAGSALVIRTSWVYSRGGGNFVQTILRRAEAGGQLRVVNDQRGTPNWSRGTAEATLRMLAAIPAADGGLFEAVAPLAGLYHVSASGVATWYDLAVAALRLRGLNREADAVVPVSSAEYGSVVSRPAYSVLSTEKASGVFGLRPAGWRQELGEMLAERQ